MPLVSRHVYGHDWWTFGWAPNFSKEVAFLGLGPKAVG